MITRDEVLAYLGIDYADDMVNRNIDRMINTADAYLKGSIGEDYPSDDPKAKELALILVADLYENRTLTEGASNMTRKLVDDLSWQLRLQLRRASDE